MKPFLILQLRPEDEASDGELESILKFAGLTKDDIHRVRMEQLGIPHVDLDDYSGVILGGGPYNNCDPEDKKGEIQRRLEQDIRELLDEIAERDFPFIGICYGVGALGQHQGCLIAKDFGEDVGAVTVKLTEEGKKDDLLKGLPEEFSAFVGHKEGCGQLSDQVVRLAYSDSCPVQMFRLKKNIYATQFHPELDLEGIITRINVYKYAGYFDPADAEELIEECKKEDVIAPMKVLENFVNKYR
jgi:GMP synthase (glutamine-hydrolysing)